MLYAAGSGPIVAGHDDLRRGVARSQFQVGCGSLYQTRPQGKRLCYAALSVAELATLTRSVHAWRQGRSR
jgi:hypothetical protein